MTPEEQRIAIAEWCGLKCKSCGNSGMRLKFGQEEYARIRSFQEKWLKDWPQQEPDIPCDHQSLPDYLNDLNAIHEAESRLTNDDWDDKFYHWLGFVVSGGQTEQLWEYRKQIVHATAAQRAEALLRTIGRWEEKK